MEYFNKNPDAKKKIVDKRVKIALTGNEELYDFALRIKNSGLTDLETVEVIEQQTDGALPKSAIKKVVSSLKDSDQLDPENRTPPKRKADPSDPLYIRKYLNQ